MTALRNVKCHLNPKEGLPHGLFQGGHRPFSLPVAIHVVTKTRQRQTRSQSNFSDKSVSSHFCYSLIGKSPNLKNHVQENRLQGVWKIYLGWMWKAHRRSYGRRRAMGQVYQLGKGIRTSLWRSQDTIRTQSKEGRGTGVPSCQH